MIKYTVRVYALLQNEKGDYLLIDEKYKGKSFTKFPGGGMEMGEGTLDCLKRELKEELNLELNQFTHFYTTDFHVASAFDSEVQVMSIYYKCTLPINEDDIDFDFADEKLQQFKFVSPSLLNANHLTFPIDKKVVELLIS